MKYFTLLLLVGSMFYFGCSSKTSVGTATTSSAPTPPPPPKVTAQATPAPAPAKIDKPKRPMGEAAPGEIQFFAANDRYSAEGTFKKWEFVDFAMDEDNFESIQGQIKVDLTSIWEKSEKLTEHLKAWDYFDVEKYTTATIEFRNVHVHGDREGHAELLLSMRGYEQVLDTHFEIINRDPFIVKGEAMVDRSIFKIGEDNKDLTNQIRVTFHTALPM